MRLDRYLIEARKGMDWEELLPQIEQIEKECSQIIKVYRSTRKFLYRAVKEDAWIIEKKGRGAKVRIPRNTPVEYHRLLNKLFRDKLGWKVRDGVSTSPQSASLGIYGDTYIFFPKNGYKYAWSPKYGDLWRDLPIMQTIIPGRTTTKEWLKKKETTFKRAVNTYKDNDLETAIIKGSDYSKGTNEIMFKVSKYYLIHYDLTVRIRQAYNI